jgi:V-type H+-transporting ATPase subunit D
MAEDDEGSTNKGDGSRFPVVASQQSLFLMKDKKRAAKNGLKLLQKKRDTIDVKLREALRKLVSEKQRIFGTTLKQAFSELTEAEWAAGDLGVISQHQSVGVVANKKVRLTLDNVAGIKLPVYSSFENFNNNSTNLVGLSKGGAEIQKAQTSFSKILEDLLCPRMSVGS